MIHHESEDPEPVKRITTFDDEDAQQEESDTDNWCDPSANLPGYEPECEDGPPSAELLKAVGAGDASLQRGRPQTPGSSSAREVVAAVARTDFSTFPESSGHSNKPKLPLVEPKARWNPAVALASYSPPPGAASSSSAGESAPDAKRLRLREKSPASPYAGRRDASPSPSLEEEPTCIADAKGGRTIVRYLFEKQHVAASTHGNKKTYADKRAYARQAWNACSDIDRKAFTKKVASDPELSPAQRQAVYTCRLYDQTEPAAVEAQVAKLDAEYENFMNARGALMTYHHVKWDLKRPKWDICNCTVDQVAALCKTDEYVKRCWTVICKDLANIVKETQCGKWSVSFEIACEELADTAVCRLHLHVVLEWREKKHIRNADQFKIAGTTPVHSTHEEESLQSRYAKSLSPMHYYLQMPKQGMVFNETNHDAYKKFRVNARWITGWLQSGKISHKDSRKDRRDSSPGNVL
jgi:hypothetical protein